MAVVEDSTNESPVTSDLATSLCVVVPDAIVSILDQRRALQAEVVSTEVTRQQLLTSAAQMGGRDDGTRPAPSPGPRRTALASALAQLRSLEQQFDDLRAQPLGGRA